MFNSTPAVLIHNGWIICIPLMNKWRTYLLPILAIQCHTLPLDGYDDGNIHIIVRHVLYRAFEIVRWFEMIREYQSQSLFMCVSKDRILEE